MVNEIGRVYTRDTYVGPRGKIDPTGSTGSTGSSQTGSSSGSQSRSNINMPRHQH